MTFGENRPLACLDEEALKDITAPANLNSGELQDVYKLQTDDFDEPETLEVFYNDGRGGTQREIVFVDPIYADRRPRICVSIDGIQAMHKTISTLTRKVDNLVDTLQRCRGAYYKELSMLREQIFQQALAMRAGHGEKQIPGTMYDPAAFISQTESEIDMEVKKKTEKLSVKVGGLETENLRLKKRVAILSIEVTHLENQLASRGQKMDIRDMCSEILDRVKIDTLIRTLRGLMEENQQELFYNVLEEVLSDFRGLKISDLLKQNQEDAEKISKLGLELLKAKQDLATAIREEKQASEALSQTTKMWQNMDSIAKDLEQSLEDATSELADAKEQVDELKKEPKFLREKINELKEEHQKELEQLQGTLDGVRKELADEKAKEPPSTLGLGSGKKGTQQFEALGDVIASVQQGFEPQEQFAVALNILKGTPNAQITKTGEMLKAIVEDVRPQLLKELLSLDHATLGTTKQRLTMAQRIMSNIPEEDSALVAGIIPPGIGKEMAVKVLEASATEEASGESHAQACGFDPNIDISKKCKWSLMRRFIKKLNSTEIKNLFDELGQRARKAILIDLFDLADPNDLEACAEMVVVEPSIQAFVKGLSDEACELFLQHTAQRTGENKAVSIVAPQLQKIRDSRISIVRHHETVQTEFSCVSDELVLSKKPKEEFIGMDFMLTELPQDRSQSSQSHRSQETIHGPGTEAMGTFARRHSQAFGYRGATQDALTVVEEAHQQATAAEAEALEADKEKHLAEQAKEAALAKEKELAAELEALKASMEQEIQERAKKMQATKEVADGEDGAAMSALLAHAREEAERAADEKIREKELALRAAQETAESQAAAFLERQEAAQKAAELLAQREADAREAKRKAEEEAASARAHRRASEVKFEEATRSMAAAEAAKMDAMRERQEALEMKAIFERRTAEEGEARNEAAQRQQEAVEAAERAREAAEKALHELETKGDELSQEERDALQAKADEEHAAKEAAEMAAQKAQELASFAQQRALEAEKQMNEATVTAHFQVLAKLSRVQAAYNSLEDRLRWQEQVTASAEKRAKEAEDREQQLCLLVSAKALARQVRQRDRVAQTLLACEQDDEEQWRLSVDGQPPDLQSNVRGDMISLAAQYLAESKDDDDIKELNLRTLTGVQEFVNTRAQAQGQSLKPPTPRLGETRQAAATSPVPRPVTASIAIQTDAVDDTMTPSGRSDASVPPNVPSESRPRSGASLGTSWTPRVVAPVRSGGGSPVVVETLHVRESMQEFLDSRPGSRSANEEASPSQPKGVSEAAHAAGESTEGRSDQIAPTQEVPQLGPRNSGEIRLPPGAVASRAVTEGQAGQAGQASKEVPGMTPSTSSASLAHTAMPNQSQQLYESASSSSVQASQLSTELPQEPTTAVFPPAKGGSKDSKGHLRGHHARRSVTDPATETSLRRTSLAEMGIAPSENRLGVDETPKEKPKTSPRQKDSKESSASNRATSKRLLHLSPGDGDFERSMEVVQVELQEAMPDPELEAKISGKKMATSLGRQVGPGNPKQAAQEAASAVQVAMKEKGLEEKDTNELAALCAGVAAAEAAAQLGYSSQDATNMATSEALAAAQACGFSSDLALQCASQAAGAVIGRAAAENSWTPSRAASCAADVLRRFVDANNISYNNLISMIAMTAHEAAETVSLVQGLRPEEAAIVGAEEASRITTELVTRMLRSHADSAARQATGEHPVGHTEAVYSPATPPTSRGQVEASRSSSRHSSRGAEDRKFADGRTALPRLPGQPQAVPQGDAEVVDVAPSRRPPPVARRLSISELTLPAMAPAASTSRRPSQMPSIQQGSSPSPVPNEQYPDASRIMNYGSGRTTEVDRRASTYLQQMQERRASLSMRKMDPPSPKAVAQPTGRGPTKPKLQGWQRLREVNAERADRRARSPPKATPRAAAGESSPDAATDRSKRHLGTFMEHVQAQQKVQRPPPVAPVAPAGPPSLAQAAGRVIRSGMVGAKAQREPQPKEELALDAAFILQEAVRGRQGKLRKPERPRAPDLRIEASRNEEASLTSQRRSSQRYQPEARQAGEPFAPDVGALFVGAGEASPQAAPRSPSVREGRPGMKTAATMPSKPVVASEGKTFNGLASPGSTARSGERDQGNLAEALSVSQLSSEKGATSAQSFYKSKEAFRPSEPEEVLARAPEDPETDALEELEMVRKTTSKSKPQNATLAPNVMPVGPRKAENSEVDQLVQRVCSGLDGKFGSVDAAFMSMSARMNRVEDSAAEGAESNEEKEDRKLVQLRSCLVESGVGFKDATLFLQAMRQELAGAMPTLQHVALSLRPGQLPQEALEMAKKKGAFSFSGSDDPNINLESIRGFSNLDARSILSGRGGGRALPSAGTRSQSPSRTQSASNSPRRSKSKGTSVPGFEPG